MYGNSLSVRRIGKVTYWLLFQGSPPWHEIKIKMVWTRSFICPRSCWRSPSLGIEERDQVSAESSKHETLLLRHWGLQTGHTGAYTSQQRYRLLRQTFRLALLSLGYTSSVLHRKSLTALILAGHSPQLWAFFYTGDPKYCAANVTTVMLPASGDVMRWSTGRLVGG